MGRTVAIGIQSFEQIIENDVFYVDKTNFIREWWESKDSVTLIARPRRFGKTLNMSMLEQFFSLEYADRGELFEGLSIWEDAKYRKLQGTYPVISLSFARVKETNYASAKEKICEILTNLYSHYSFLRDSEALTDKDREYFDRVSSKMEDSDATSALYQLSGFLYRYYGKKVIILLDEYDTPIQEAYVDGFWDELTSFIRSLFNSTFKTNPYVERAMMTGITRVSKESIFSDLNNLKVVTTTSDEYATSFGFTEEEVFAAMDEMGMTEKEKVKKWYDGFVFGKVRDIYNPWSIINLLDTGKFSTYWANTSSNSLVSRLIRQGSRRIKEQFETLMQGGCINTEIDEQIVYNLLDDNEEAIWSLLLASGYLKVLKVNVEEECYQLTLTNYEVKRMFRNMIRGWFKKDSSNYNDFIQALLLDDVDAMNEYMNRVTRSVFSSFDTGKRPSSAEPERFYHGFVLGLMMELQDCYIITSNRESGFARYDVILYPRKDDDAIIMEFKVFNKRREKNLEDTLASVLRQIEEKQYAQTLIDQGIASERIRKYGFAFEGKEVLIG
ncbi:MAG: AAA family ATPase [Lachnospiraceae bacterium]|nr:AAA family ATPase [Lachnospiraceae bacterium]